MSKILFNYGDWSANDTRKKLNAYGAVGYYRQIKPSQQLKKHEVKVVGKEILHYGDNIEQQWDNVFKQHDVFCTSYFSDDRAGSAIIYHAKKHGKKLVIDIDDNYLDVPESNLLYERFKPGKRERAMLSTILAFADALTVSTEPLRERLFDHFKLVHGVEKKIYVIPNMNDASDWRIKEPRTPTDRVTIGYTGSHSHHDDLMMVAPALREIMVKHKNVYLQVMGIVEKEKVAEYFGSFPKDCLDRIELIAGTNTFAEYPGVLASQVWDIGIAPLVDTPFTRSKSHIKWMEYATAGIPTIASRVYPYFVDLKGRKIIEDGKTGILCRKNQFVEALESLVTNPTLRAEIGKNAQEAVIERWQYKDGDIAQTVDKMLTEIA